MQLVKKQVSFIRWVILCNYSKLPVDIRTRLCEILNNCEYENDTYSQDKIMLNQLRGDYLERYDAFISLAKP